VKPLLQKQVKGNCLLRAACWDVMMMLIAGKPENIKHIKYIPWALVTLLDAFSAIFLSFGVPQYSNRLDYIKACDQQFTLTTKKSLHITFNAFKPQLDKFWQHQAVKFDFTT